MNVIAAADADPGNALANAYAGIVWMFLEAEEAPEKAGPYVERALAAAGGASERERRIAELAHCWTRNDIPGLLDRCEDITDHAPRDLAVVKLAQYHLFNRGDAAGMLRMGLKALPVAEDVAALHGMIAFGYEQCHLLEEAEASAHRALSLDANEPWAHHALAHVMLTEGRIEEGRDFLNGVSASWEHLNSFMHTHNWWHLALFHLARGGNVEALGIYDSHVWGIFPEYSQDQVGAVSLLARMEFAGVDVGDRWADVADHVARRGNDTVNPFLCLQYLHALGKTGRPEADQVLRNVEAAARDEARHDREVWAEVALPACRGLLAATRGDDESCVRLLTQTLPRMAEAGGSHAQRDLFAQIHLQSLLRTNRLSEAQQVLEARRRNDPDNVPVNRLLAGVYEKLGLPGQAKAARERWQRFVPKN